MCNFTYKGQMFFFCLAYMPIHCRLRNYGLARDGDHITLCIYKYVAGLGGEIMLVGSRGRGAGGLRGS